MNIKNSNGKKSLGFRNMQEKLENENTPSEFFLPHCSTRRGGRGMDGVGERKRDARRLENSPGPGELGGAGGSNAFPNFTN